MAKPRNRPRASYSKSCRVFLWVGGWVGGGRRTHPFLPTLLPCSSCDGRRCRVHLYVLTAMVGTAFEVEEQGREGMAVSAAIMSCQTSRF